MAMGSSAADSPMKKCSRVRTLILLLMLVCMLLGASAVQLPCTLVDDHTVNVVNLTSSMLEGDKAFTFRGCEWTNARVDFNLNVRAGLELLDVKIVGGSCSIGSGLPEIPEGSSLTVEGANVSGVTEAFSANTTHIAAFSLLLRNSTVAAESSAACIFAAAMEGITIVVEDSLVNVENIAPFASAAAIGSPSFASFNATNVRIVARRSTITTNASLAAASVGAAAVSSGTVKVSVQGLSMVADHSDIVSSTYNGASAAVGFVASGAHANVNISDSTIHGVGSTATSAAHLIAAAFGVASRSFESCCRSSSSVISTYNFSIYVEHCTAVASAAAFRSAAASFGIASRSFSSEDSISSIDANSFTIHATKCDAEATVAGSHSAAASFGVASTSFCITGFKDSSSIVSAADVTIYGEECSANSTTVGGSYSSVAAFGFASRSYVPGNSPGSSSIVIHNFVMLAEKCNATAEKQHDSGVRYLAAASFGAASSCYSGSESCSSSVATYNFTIYATRCNAAATTGEYHSTAASFGVASSSYSASNQLSCSSSSTVVAHNATLYGEQCNAVSTAWGQNAAAASFGVVSGSYSFHQCSSSSVSVADAAIYGEECNAVTTLEEDYSAAASFGVASQSFSPISSANSRITSYSFILGGERCNAEATTPRYYSAAASFGLASYSNRNSIVNLQSFQLFVCGSSASTVAVSASAVAALGAFGDEVSVDAHWIVVNTSVIAPLCMNVAPSPGALSVMSGVSMECENEGWNGVVGAYVAREIFVDAKPCSSACLNSTFPGLQEADGSDALFSATCNSSFARPNIVDPRPDVGPLPQKPHTASPSPSASLSLSGSVTSSLTAALTDTSVSSSMPIEAATASREETLSRTDTPTSTVGLSWPSRVVSGTVVASIRGWLTFSRTSTISLLLDRPTLMPPHSTPTAALSIIIPNDAAQAVTTGGTISTVTVGALTPAVATQYARIGAVLRVMNCHLPETDDSVSRLEHPCAFPLGAEAMQWYAGACLSDVLVILVLSTAQFVLLLTTRRDTASRLRVNVVKITGICASLAMAYLLPNSFSAASILIFAENRSSTELVVAIFSLIAGLVPLSFAMFLAWNINNYAKWVVNNESKIDVKYAAHSASSLLIEAYSKFFDDTREPASNWCRMLFFEEIMCSCICAFISAIRVNVSCLSVILPILVISALHLLYVITFRPYNRKLANVFSVGSAIIILSIGVVATVVFSEGKGQVILGYLLLCQNSIFFAQAVVEGAWTYVVRSRREIRRKQDDAATDSASVPMLPPTNPLDQQV